MPSRYEKNEKKRKSARKKKQRNFLKKFTIFLVILIIGLIIWGKFGEPNILTIKEYKIESVNLPNSFNGVKIIQFSDIHYGTGFSEKRLKNLINEINSIKPDIVIFTGDLIDKNYNATDKDIQILTNYLSKIESKLGKYATIGNHDFYNENFDNIMYDSDFKVLKNNYDTVYNKTNKPIVIYGIDNITYGNPKVSTLTNKEIDNISYKIVILHEPDYIDEFINNYDIDLILAGHSHNGQAKLPFLKSFYLPNNAKNYYANYYKSKNTDIYISSGVGNSIIDFRLFNPPSINVYRLNTK
ncbi:MAG: metallophosphoesterase [Bacilli bacterium]